jgi:hypothetical protein
MPHAFIVTSVAPVVREDAVQTLSRVTAFPQGASTYDCACCGRTSRSIWGEVCDVQCEIVVYYCHWTVGDPEHEAYVDLILGPWGEGVTPEDRVLVSLQFRRSKINGGFMVIDAQPRQAKLADICGEGIPREEVMGTCLAQAAFMTVDVIWIDDPRIADLMAAR